MKKVEKETVLTGQNARTKEIAIAAVLLAIGAVLRGVSPSIAGITPNWVIAMYCLAVILTRPKILGAVGIGFAAGAISMVTSKSPVPYINLITEPVGAVVALFFLTTLPALKIKEYSLKPFLVAFFGTIASGTLYVILNKVFLSLPLEVAKVAFLTVVIPVTLLNATITQILYYPASKFLK